MKTIKILLSISLFITVISCDKNNKIPDTWGAFEMNGTHWQAQKTSVNKINDTLFGFSLVKGKYWAEYDIDTAALSFNFLRKELGRKTVFNRRMEEWITTLENTPTIASFNLQNNDFGFLSEAFRPLESDSVNNWIEITKQEDNYKKVWGKFSITLIKEGTNQTPNYPDTLRIRNGSFYVEM